MLYSTVAFAGLAALASAQTFTGTATVSPTAAAPSGCSTTYATTFELSVVNVTTTSSKAKVCFAFLTITARPLSDSPSTASIFKLPQLSCHLAQERCPH